MTDTDLAWCAGFFDGEGCVRYYRTLPNNSTNRVSAQLICSVAQASDNIETLEEFQRIVGLGKIKGPYKMPNGRDQHRLSFATNEVESLCKLLAKYLKRKKLSDFHAALYQFWSHDTKPTSEDFARKIKRSKKKGCPTCGAEWNGLICFECEYGS